MWLLGKRTLSTEVRKKIENTSSEASSMFSTWVQAEYSGDYELAPSLSSSEY